MEQVNIRTGEQWRRKEFKKNVFVRFTCGQLFHCSTFKRRQKIEHLSRRTSEQ